MKPMLLHDAEEIPLGDEWVYETKYDGFRCILEWNESGIRLLSRNGKLLNRLFPEIVIHCESIHGDMEDFLPVCFDGEIVQLQSDVKSEFSKVQTRGRMKKEEVIHSHVKAFPCQYVAFDILLIKGKEIAGEPFEKRKTKLGELFKTLGQPMEVDYQNPIPLQLIKTYKSSKKLWEHIVNNNGEGIIAKKKSSPWISGKRTDQWIKVKNWRTVNIIVTRYVKANGFFTGCVYKGTELYEVVTFRHGLTDEEAQTLSTFFLANGKESHNGIWELKPSICVKVNCIDFDGNQLREPRFHSFNFEVELKAVNWRTMLRQLNPIPDVITITHPDKPIWARFGIEKDDYLLYLQTVAPYMLPFLHDRLLTVIRYPHGANGEKFYQKNSPDYTPDFVMTSRYEDIDYVVCNDIRTLLWLGNQLSLEFHIPFQTLTANNPTEIVFDLDPPSIDDFSLAVEAASMMKVVFDELQLKSFVKTSGGKGLQIYIPLLVDTFSYEDTRLFTKFICDFLCEQQPQWFTTERLKKNRNNKLYLDYVQHQSGKTIVAPFSPRGNEFATVATPLQWEEVNHSLNPKMFTLPTVMERIQTGGNPFREFREAGEQQQFKVVLEQLKAILK
ncbi:DNA ligase D [Sporosarcina sp. Sa2YVA2]|uniref:DNA ligase (ATP) n=1 Tax=Sporosarcina quadrami TaxID=2762234 RepID=A0ABR8U8G3_9BACL|nr:DNA ligase D [Sporosarcina quadrami]MBD7984323.1 DNA ligase D [Sporosarcina quadrami]